MGGFPEMAMPSVGFRQMIIEDSHILGPYLGYPLFWGTHIHGLSLYDPERVEGYLQVTDLL